MGPDTTPAVSASSGGTLAVYSQGVGGARGGLLAKCTLGLVMCSAHVACPFKAPKREKSADLLFVFEPPATGGVVHLDSWSITSSF